jgi:hypothetical protein
VWDRFPNWKNAKIRAVDPHQIKRDRDRSCAQTRPLARAGAPALFPKPKRGEVAPAHLRTLHLSGRHPKRSAEKCLTYLPVSQATAYPSPSVGRNPYLHRRRPNHLSSRPYLWAAVEQARPTGRPRPGPAGLGGPTPPSGCRPTCAGRRRLWWVKWMKQLPPPTLLAGIDWEEPRLLALLTSCRAKALACVSAMAHVGHLCREEIVLLRRCF